MRGLFVKSLTPLGEPNFRILWFTFVLANIAMWMFDTTATLYLVASGASPLEIALVQTASALPVFLLGIPSGALADLVCRRKLYLFAQFALFLGSLVMFLFMQFSIVTSGTILLFVFLYGIGFSLRWPAYASMVPLSLPRAMLQQAFALNSAAMNLARIIGPVVAGWLFITYTGALAFLAISLISLYAFFLILKSNIPGNPSSFSVSRIFPAIKEGAVVCWRSKVVRQVLLLVFFFFFSGISTIALAAIVGLQWLPSNALAYSFLLSSMGLGAISAVMLLPFLGRKLDTRTLLNVSLTTQGILIMLLSVIRNEMSLYLLFFASGFFWVCVVSILTVTIQMALDNSYRARGMSFYQICIMGGSAAGASAWGTLSTYLSLEAAFLTSGAMLLTSLFIPFSAKQINS